MTDAIQAAAYRILEGTGTMDDAAAVSLAHLRMIKTRAGKADAMREARDEVLEEAAKVADEITRAADDAGERELCQDIAFHIRALKSPAAKVTP